MKSSSNYGAGIALSLGSILCVITMLLLPVGQSVQQIASVRVPNIMAHSIAIFAVPFLYLGGKGLREILKEDWFFANIGQSFFSFAILAALLAASCNGLALPFFVDSLDVNAPGIQEQVENILSYGFALNRGFDYIFMTGVAIAIILWGVAILRTNALSRALGMAGLLIGALGVYTVFSGTLGIHLHEFKIYVFGFVAWTIWAGVEMLRFKSPKS